MRHRCYVRSCKHISRTNSEDIQIHRFPISMKKIWLQILQEPADKVIPKSSVLCSRHFRDEDYEIRGTVKRLKKNSVPSVNLPTKPSNQLIPQDELKSSLKLVPIAELCGTAVNNTKKQERSDESEFEKLYDSDLSTDSCNSTDSTFQSSVLSTTFFSPSIEMERNLTKIFHSYSRSPDYAHEQLIIQKNRNALINMKLKYVAKKNRLYKKRISSLKVILKDLRKRNDYLEKRHLIESGRYLLQKRQNNTQKKTVNSNQNCKSKTF